MNKPFPLPLLSPHSTVIPLRRGWSGLGSNLEKIMNLICSCCGGYAPAKKQWWNQDKGYGICARCFLTIVAHDSEEEAVKSYGKPGIHHSTDIVPPGMKITGIQTIEGRPRYSFIEL